MTAFEHAMLGITGSLAAGLDRRYGWPIVAAAGVASVLPDWDGLSILFGAAAFEHVHRAWGHNLLVAGLIGAAWMAAAYRFKPAGRARRILQKLVRAPVGAEVERDAATGHPDASSAGHDYVVWIIVGTIVSWSHLAADAVFSGHATYSDWGVQLFWPFSDRAFAYPLVPWGDVGTTLIFVTGMFAMVRWPAKLHALAAATLVLAGAYIVVLGLLW